ncbi:MAG: DoxX family protein [Bacteroidia bacterium]|nr:DoxX family protein [Bacteroidia bacterium]MBT8228764.1 DoxX family protein [Bacteroidia bacterium]NNK90222.1 DoxX family protein [Saprospiraceae bacterium]
MKKYFFLIIRIVVAVILLQTLRYKFSAHPDSVYIFSTVGLEPVGRIFIGVAELVAALLILIPRTIWLGASLTAGILAGAIIMHLTLIGIEVQGDKGTLFYIAVLTFILSLVILWNERKKIPIIKNYLGA